MLTFGLPKGRLQKPLLALLKELGPLPDDLASRRLVLERGDLRFLPLKDPDVPTYVEHGAADLGVVGSDVLLEHPANVLEPLDLGFGRCTLALAGYPETDLRAIHARGALRVATKYPRTARRMLAQRGLVGEVIESAGSVEVSVLAGLADCIVDLVETGKTLESNGLVILEPLIDISARLVINRAAFRLRSAELMQLTETLKRRAREAGHEAT